MSNRCVAVFLIALFLFGCSDSQPSTDRPITTDQSVLGESGPSPDRVSTGERNVSGEAGQRDGATGKGFRFVSWADSKPSGWPTQKTISPMVKAKSPALVLYPGDLCDSGPSASCLAQWQTSYEGGTGNGLLSVTFASRGNHDSDNAGAWQAFFDFAKVASNIGAKNYSAQSEDLTYSFDYGNSHFVALDSPDGSASTIDVALAGWLDKDLTAAEGRGLTHTFIEFHGPVYWVDGHQDSGLKPEFITVFNKHSIISATFHGHEHVQAYVHIDSSRIAQIKYPFEEFVTGGAGAGLYNCASGRSDWCSSTHGYTVIDVNGKSFTVSTYIDTNATPAKTWTFTKP